MTLFVRDEADVLDAQIAYHLNAGVDFVLATDRGSQDGTRDVLDAYSRENYLRLVPQHGDAREADWRVHLARLATTEHGADWVIPSDADEFWWPRGESLEDVLAVIPERYGIVQALVRVFPPRPGDGHDFAERMAVRPSLLVPEADWGEPLEWALRPVYRAAAAVAAESRSVPLRAWYPIEVLRFPLRSLEQAGRSLSARPEPRSRIEARALEAFRQGALAEHWDDLVVDDEQLAHGLADGSLAVDERLRDALGVLREDAGSGRRFALPAGGASRLALHAPDIVDDASYAVECAAVGEVDLERLDRQLRELEGRIAWLEARFWPRVLRRVSRVVRR
jgi:hypothetical protein